MRTIMRIGMAVLLAMLLLPVQGRANLVKVKGKGEVVYTGVFKQGSEEERTAIVAAKKNAITRYAAGLDASKFELFQRVEPEILANLDLYVTDYIQLSQETDKTSKRYSVVIEASINQALVENLIKKSTQSKAAPGSEASYLTFVFVARELASAKKFDEKRTTVEISEASSNTSETAAISEDGQSSTGATEANSVAKKVTGGNTERKATELTYRVMTVTEVDNAVNAVMTTAGYETVDPVDAGIEVEAFKTDFSSGSDISAATRKAAIAVLKENQVRYLAIANMDVGLSAVDEVSGLQRVFVTVTAKVTDLSTKFPKTIASIAGKPYSGIGSDEQVARQNALNEAARQSASELVSQLQVKNVR